MGLFSQQITCPKCHLPGAVKKFFFIVSCPNVRCENYDSALAESLHLKSQKIPSAKTETESGSPRHKSLPSQSEQEERDKVLQPDSPGLEEQKTLVVTEPGPYQGEELCLIRYENYLGKKTEFLGLVGSLWVTPKKISVMVAPHYWRICLGRKRVANFDEIAALELPVHSTLRKLSKGEKQTLAYHNKRGSTSERHHELLAKYPELKLYTGKSVSPPF